MKGYSVQYRAQAPAHFSRVQLALRLVVFVLLGLLGLSFGLVLAFLYLGLPAYAATRIQSDGSAHYVREEGPRVIRLLHWFAAGCAWAGLVVDSFPKQHPGEAVALQVAPSTGAPTPASALLRVVTGLPNALFVLLACLVASLVWVWSAGTVLLRNGVGPTAHHVLEGVQRAIIRLLVYQASLVEAYPPTTLHADSPPPGLPSASDPISEPDSRTPDWPAPEG